MRSGNSWTSPDCNRLRSCRHSTLKVHWMCWCKNLRAILTICMILFNVVIASRWSSSKTRSSSSLISYTWYLCTCSCGDSSWTVSRKSYGRQNRCWALCRLKDWWALQKCESSCWKTRELPSSAKDSANYPLILFECINCLSMWVIIRFV